MLLVAATQQPWLGLSLAVDKASGAVHVESVDFGGPSASVPVGSTVLGLEDVSGRRMALFPGDLVEEPDVAESYPELRTFFDRQDAFARSLTADRVSLLVDNSRAIELRPTPSRPLRAVPHLFWVQVFTGLVTMIVGVWIWSLRRRELPAQLLALAGVAIAIAAFPAALYSTRELALPAPLFPTLSAINHLGTMTFGVAMVALLLCYPRRLVPLTALWLLPVVVGAFWIVDTAKVVLPGSPLGFHLPAVALMLCIVVGAVLQFRATRDDPAARAALRWFGLSVCIGAGTFVAVILLPNLFGIAPGVSQGYAFVLFMLLFLGVAAGVARYRLFDLEQWAFSILFYFIGAVLLILFDAILVTYISIGRMPAFGLALLVVALAYLPVRDRLARWLMRHKEVDRTVLFGRIVDVALTKDATARTNGWQEILRDMFHPLQLEPMQGDAPEAPLILEEGMALALPRAGTLGPVRLSYAHSGRRLFSRSDQRFAAELCALLAHAIERRNAHDKGVAEERTRIARDMHDNIGAQLLSALHSQVPDRKDVLIREAIYDIRGIINNLASGNQTLNEALAELRLETLLRLEMSEIDLDWHAEGLDASPAPTPQLVHGLRSIIREALSNAIRHSSATRITIAAFFNQDSFVISIADNGIGIGDDSVSGNGLANMRNRAIAMNGRFELADNAPGTKLTVKVPLT